MSMVGRIVGGVDTPADSHVAAAVDANGGILGVESFPADESGFEASIGWLSSHGEIQVVGVEGSGSWDVGLARFLHNHEISAVEVDRPNCQDYGRKCDSERTLQAGGPWVQCRTVARARPRGGRVMPC